jgi:uncharacterized Ntn-hydrolase superfamily protein
MMQPIATFSIVAYDPGRQEWGVAVQSKFLAVGAIVPWAKAGAGAVATQSYANLRYGSDGLDLMAQGMTAVETIAHLTETDEGRATRQVGLVDAKGEAAAYTGDECHAWAGHQVGEGYACQGNILLPGTVEAMASSFEEARRGAGELADWLVAALAAGQEAGGDSRGRQSAAVLVVRAGGGYGGNNDHYLDLRVDDHPTPIVRLQELLQMHHLFFGAVDPADLIPLSDIAADMQTLLRKSGHYDGPISGTFDDATHSALRDLVGQENLEERWDGSGDTIDKITVEYLKRRLG